MEDYSTLADQNPKTVPSLPAAVTFEILQTSDVQSAVKVFGRSRPMGTVPCMAINYQQQVHAFFLNRPWPWSNSRLQPGSFENNSVLEIIF